ncbi:hypothetical protein HN51_037229 [Arachis hypogaea]
MQESRRYSWQREFVTREVKEVTRMIPEQWASPCGGQCNNKYAALTQIPWRVFCKKGCDADGDTWEECLEECNQLCYKDPVLENQKWSAYIDRSPGSESYSEECFHACVSGCSYRFEVEAEIADKVIPNRPPKSEPEPQPVKKQKPQYEDPKYPDTSA